MGVSFIALARVGLLVSTIALNGTPSLLTVRYIRGTVPNFNQSEARKHFFLAPETWDHSPKIPHSINKESFTHIVHLSPCYSFRERLQI